VSRKAAWALGALCAMALGCSLRPPRVGAPGPELPNPDAERAYQEVLARYTSHRELYALFDTRMLAAVTYQALVFREARVRRLGLFQAQPAELVAKNLADEEAEASQYHDFFLGAHLNEYRYDDFDRKDSIWRIALVTPAGELVPSSVERIGRSNLNLRAFYPYLDDFWVAYRIRFPRVTASGAPVVPGDASTLVLRVASVLGKADFVFPTR
jgi:hypothetical protein